ncbi:MAG: hypothetical protein GX591_04660 [Planctomycetes bacterium]|nr:hypothetical protein [Planctomycetota bacterium]
MRKPFKIIGGVVGGLLAVVVLAVVLVWISLGSIAARVIVASIEKTGEVPAAVDDVSISVFGGRMGIDGLVVGNPQGFPEATMFSIDQAEVAVRLRSLLGDPIHVQTLEILSPSVRVDAGLQGTNVQAFLANVQRKLGVPESREPAEAPSEPKRLVIDRLLIRDARVHLAAGLVPAEVTATLPTVELTDIRGDQGRGVTPAQLAALIVVELVKQGAGQLDADLDDLIPPDLIEDIEQVRELGEDLLQRGREAIERGEGTLEDLEGAGREAAEEVRDRLRGILDGGKDEAPQDGRQPTR